MYPTLSEEDRLLIIRMQHLPAHWLHKGQIVIGTTPSQTNSSTHQEVQFDRLFVKRLIGLPHDRVTVSLNKIHQQILSTSCTQLTWEIPQAHCFVKGDAYQSRDSVVWGPIKLDAIIGIALLKLPNRNADFVSLIEMN